MEQQIQKEKRMEQKESARNADYLNPQKLRVMLNTTPGRNADHWSMFAGCGKGYPEILNSGAHTMACTGCARRRAKLKKLLDLANERFEELKQRITGAAVSPSADTDAGRNPHKRDSPGR